MMKGFFFDELVHQDPESKKQKRKKKKKKSKVKTLL